MPPAFICCIAGNPIAFTAFLCITNSPGSNKAGTRSRGDPPAANFCNEPIKVFGTSPPDARSASAAISLGMPILGAGPEIPKALFKMPVPNSAKGWVKVSRRNCFLISFNKLNKNELKPSLKLVNVSSPLAIASKRSSNPWVIEEVSTLLNLVNNLTLNLSLSRASAKALSALFFSSKNRRSACLYFISYSVTFNLVSSA